MAEQQPMLTSEEQYRAELKAIARLSKAERDELVGRARSGDEAARTRLIMECLHFVQMAAYKLSSAYLPEGYLDLIGIGNLALVEHIARALTKEVPTLYLCGIARREMQSYCFYHSRLIRVPEQPHLLRMAPSTVSYEETIAASPLAEMMADLESEDQAGFNATYGALYEALSTLSDMERDAIAYRTGIGEPGNVERSDRQIERGYYRALTRLRRRLKRA
jgi:DNA-directed RNA polymerase sigma subunit (sigma70/sigma32)